MTETPASQKDKRLSTRENPAKPTYEQRVEQLIEEGLTNSDAQGIADMEAMQGLLSTIGIYK